MVHTISHVQALRPFGSCDIGDALVKLKYPFGGFLHGISMWSPTRAATLGLGEPPTIIGEATTVKMVRADDTTSPTPDKHFADNNRRGKIMFIQQPRNVYSACFGGLMGARATRLGAAGVVVDGLFRDVTELQRMGLPLFARGTAALGSHTFTRASELDVRVHFKGDLYIHPGDLIIGDQDGVVVAPPRLIKKIIPICEERKEIDEKMMRALKTGVSMTDAMLKFRKPTEGST